MITPGAFIFKALTNAPAVTDLVGRRIVPSKQEKITTPYIQYRKVRGMVETSHGGKSGLSHPIYRLRLVANDYTQLEQLELAVDSVLTEFRGTVADFVVQNCTLLASGDEDDENETDPKLCVRLMDYEIWHKS